MKKILLFLITVVTCIAASADEVTFDFSKQGYGNAQDLNGETIDLGNGISLTLSKGTGGTTPKYYDGGTAIRLYAGNTATFTASNTITSIVITYSTVTNVGTIVADCGEYDLSVMTGTWTGSSTSVELRNTSSAQARMQTVVVTYNAGETTASRPSLTNGGTFTAKPYVVTITNNEAGSTVYYTLDGTEPTTGSESFTGESKQIEISETTTVKAMSVVAGKANSSVASATYTYEESIANTKESAYTTEQAQALIDANSEQLKTVKVYVKGQVSKVDNFNQTYGSITYWLDDNAFQIYGGLDDNGNKFEDINSVKVGAEVVVYGLIKKYNTTYEMDMNNWLVSYTAPTKPEPTLTAEVKTALETGSSDVYGISYTGDAQEYHYTSSDESVATIDWNDEDCEFTVTALKAGSTTITISTDETANYLAKTFSYKLTVTEKNVPAAIPFEFDGGKADITPATGMSATGLGSDYSKSPKLKFDGNGDNLVVNIASDAKYLHYVIKGNGSGAEAQSGEFTVEESADGETYTSLRNYTTINGQFAVNNVALSEGTRYIRFTYVEKSIGNVALGSIRINNEAAELAAATFEENVLDSESVRYFESENPSTPWVSGGYTFTTYTADYGTYGKYYSSYALSNKTTTDGKVSDFALESACGKAKSGKNYAVWFDNAWYGGSKVTLDVPSAITGFYVTNTTSTVDAIINGDGMSTVAGGFQNGDYLKLTVTGYDAEGNEGNSIDYILAEAKDGKIYYVKDWRWVDLSALGVVSAIETKLTGTKTNTYGLTTPTYFCMDDLGGVAPETDADMAEADTPTAIVNINADNSVLTDGKFLQEGQVVIRKGGKTYTTSGRKL